MPVRVTERGRAARFDSAGAQVFHQVAHVEQFADIVPAVELAARVNCVGPALDDCGCDVWAAVDARQLLRLYLTVAM